MRFISKSLKGRLVVLSVYNLRGKKELHNSTNIYFLEELSFLRFVLVYT